MNKLIVAVLLLLVVYFSPVVAGLVQKCGGDREASYEESNSMETIE